MDTNRFDTISKLFASRRTRRAAVTGGIGLAATTALGRHVAAQDATPSVTDASPHPNAGVPDTTYLFTQAFHSGTWEPKSGQDNVYTLTLNGAPAQTILFSDRPERVFGTWPMQAFLDQLGFTPDNPPNAALVTQSPDTGEEDVVIVELLNPQYDPDAGTLSYDASVLADYTELGLASAATKQQDYDFPASFEQGGLFIDGLCDSENITCYADNGTGAEVGTTTVGTCWKFPDSCVLCHSGPSDCADAFPDQCVDADGNDTCDQQQS
jgi:hypothetical protein